VIFHTPLALDAPVRGGPCQNIAVPFDTEKLEWCTGYPMVKKTLRICITVYTEYRRVTDRRTDGQTGREIDRHLATAYIVRAMHTRRAVKMQAPASRILKFLFSFGGICTADSIRDLPLDGSRWGTSIL